MKKVILSTTAIVALLAVSSCGKYEEGPGLSLRTKKARLTGVWDTKEYVSANGTVVADNGTETVEIIKDGTMKLVDGSVTTAGKWALINDKEDIEFAYDVNVFGSVVTIKDTAKIVRLTNKEIWTKDSDGDITKSVKL